MDPYHWQIMVQCVWFTSATHLASIPILKAQLYKDESKVSRLLIYIRATLMSLVLAMLIAALVPTGHPDWIFGSSTQPALCFFDYNFRTGGLGPITAFAGIWLSWSIGLATITFLKRLIELLTPPKMGQRSLSSRPNFRSTRLQAWNTYMDYRMGRYAITKALWLPTQETFRTVWRLLESLGWHVSCFTALFTRPVIFHSHEQLN